MAARSRAARRCWHIDTPKTTHSKVNRILQQEREIGYRGASIALAAAFALMALGAVMWGW